MTYFTDNWYLFATALLSGALLLWPMLRGGTYGGKITPAQAVTLINREKGVLIDVSEKADYAAAHAGGAKNLPLSTLETATDVPKNKALPLLVISSNAGHATRAVGILKKRGYERAQAVAGGLAAWREANLPVEKSA